MTDHMPIQRTALSIRMDVLSDEQAKRNHNQSLQRLAERGGVDPVEAAALILCEPFDPDMSEARAWRLLSIATRPRLLARFQRNRQRERRAPGEAGRPDPPYYEPTRVK